MNCTVRHIRKAPAGAVGAVVLATGLMLAGCKTIQPTDMTAGAVRATAARADPDWRRSAEKWGERYRANPKDPDAAIQYAQALRGSDRRSQAVAVLEQASIQNPRHPGVLGAYGRALADVGHYEHALDVLNRAHGPIGPTGASSRCKERCWTRWAATRKPSATMGPL